MIFVVERKATHATDGWEPIMGDNHFATESEARESLASWSEMDHTETLRVAIYTRSEVLN